MRSSPGARRRRSVAILKPTAGPLAGLLALTAAYTLSQFFRTALAVVAPEIAADLGLDAFRLGVLSAAWFLAFAAAQIPVGMALDRYGSRRTVGLLFMVAALGAAVFAAADGFAVAVLAQVLLGIGCAPVFMGTLVVIARWYPPERFAFLTSIALAAGSAGTVVGTTPLALLAGAVGWRGAFLTVMAAVLLAAGAVLLLVRDRPADAAAPSLDPPRELLRGLTRVVTNRRLWPILPLSFAVYATLVTVRGLWAGPYLATIFDLPPVPRGNVLLLMSLGMIAGTLIYGRVERALDRRREPVVVGTSLAIASLAGLALLPAGLVLVTIFLVVLGAAGNSYPLLMAQGRRFLNDAEVGRGLTLLNGVCFLGAAVLQGLSGLVITAARGLGADESLAYATLYLFLAVYLGLALLAYTRSEDRRLRRPASA
jgi:predicted MFS family arabinose efflux permease